MRYLLALCILILIGTAAAAFELPLLQKDHAISAESLLESAPTLTLILPGNPQSLAPAGRVKPSGLTQLADLVDSFLAEKSGDRLDLRSSSGWSTPFTLRQPAREDGASQSAAPEPAMLFLLGAGLIGLAGIARRGLQH